MELYFLIYVRKENSFKRASSARALEYLPSFAVLLQGLSEATKTGLCSHLQSEKVVFIGSTSLFGGLLQGFYESIFGDLLQGF